MSVCPLGDLKKNHVCFFCPGGALALTGTYFLVTFAPHSSPHVTANMVERSLVSWQFLIYFVRLIYHLKSLHYGQHLPYIKINLKYFCLQMFEAILFAVLMYLYKCRNIKHIIIMMLLVALLGKITFFKCMPS